MPFNQHKRLDVAEITYDPENTLIPHQNSVERQMVLLLNQIQN